MKKVLLSLSVALISIIAYGQNVKLHVQNLPSKGSLLVGVCINNEQFMTSNYESSQKIKLDGTFSETDVFFDLPDGVYGVSIMVDENNNFDFDMGELYGFSNGYIPREQPTFDKFKFTLDGNVHEESIMLRNDL